MDMLMLKEELFIGKGRHKKTYVHPEDSNLCVKFGYSDEGVIDLEREIAYRVLRDRQGLETSLLPTYIGGGENKFWERTCF